MPHFPKHPDKIRERIKRYEDDLRKEYRKFRYISDDSGKRYLIGPMYLLADDTPGAVKAFAWYKKHFPDDIGDPFHTLCWALALYRSNDRTNASKKLRRAMISNLYLLPNLFGIEQPQLDMWHSSNLEGKAYIEQGPAALLKIWDDQALEWAKALYQSDNFREARARCIEICKQLESEHVGPTRTALVHELSALKYTD